MNLKLDYYTKSIIFTYLLLLTTNIISITSLYDAYLKINNYPIAIKNLDNFIPFLSNNFIEVVLTSQITKEFLFITIMISFVIITQSILIWVRKTQNEIKIHQQMGANRLCMNISYVLKLLYSNILAFIMLSAPFVLYSIFFFNVGIALIFTVLINVIFLLYGIIILIITINRKLI